jgi:hypothetical protein
MKTKLTPLTRTTCSTMLAVATLALSACTAVLPSTSNISKTPWTDYVAAKTAFDTINPTTTTRKQLTSTHFTPETIPNSRILNYVDVVNLFGSAFRLEDLPPGIKTCVEARDACEAYIITAQNIQNKREGNIARDLFGFGKVTRTTGWEFQATLVLVKDVVVYKLWKGTPTIEATERQRTPLGPMQNLGSILKPNF